VLERDLRVPPGRRAEGHALALPVDDQPRGDALDPAGREPRRDLAPEHRADLVAVETVEDAPRLLRVDQVHGQLAAVRDGLLDRGPGDLVEDHAPHRHLRAQQVEQVPGDRLTLAVLVGREVERARLLAPGLELADARLLVGGDDVERLESVVDVDPEARPALALVGGRDLRRRRRQVANVADRGLDHPVRAQEPGDGAGLGG
jgi:hypothetical protein